MADPRALVIFFTGGEITRNTLDQIRYLMHNDYHSNAQNIVVASLDKNDLVASIMYSLNHMETNCAKEDTESPKIKININPEHKIDLFDKHVSTILETFGEDVNTDKASVNLLIEMLCQYGSSASIREAFGFLAKRKDSEFDKTPISKEFIHKIRDVVKMYV